MTAWIVHQYAGFAPDEADQPERYFGPYPNPVVAAQAAVERQRVTGVICTVQKGTPPPTSPAPALYPPPPVGRASSVMARFSFSKSTRRKT